MGPSDLPNIFILTADSLRADAFSETMEEVTSLMSGVEFTDAVSTASATDSSMPALAAGVYGDTVQTATGTLRLGESRKKDGFVTMAERLSEVGYQCSLWSRNPIFGAVRNYDRGFVAGKAGTPTFQKRAQAVVQQFGSDRLFSVCRWLYFNVFTPIKSIITEETYFGTAHKLHESTLNSLGDNRTGGQMHWLHYMDTHHPFDPPTEYLERRTFNSDWNRGKLSELSSRTMIASGRAETTDKDIADIREAYLACCEYLRDELAVFIRELQDRGHFVPGRDIMVFTADHGEGFSLDKHGILGHTPTPSFWEDLIKVPLVVSHPEWTPETIDYQVSLIDIMPTVLAAIDVDVPESVEGRAARQPDDLHREHTYFTSIGPKRIHRGIRAESGWKLFSDRINTTGGSESNSDREDDYERVLLTTFNGEETVQFESEIEDGSRPSEGVARETYTKLSAMLDRHRGGLVTEKEREGITNEMEQQLRDLGYIDDVPSER